jgi:hypothetical protein
MLRIAVALACAGIMTVGGLPSLTGEAEARPPRKGKPCEELFDLTGDPAPDGSLPWENDRDNVRPAMDWDSYLYYNPRQAMDGLNDHLPADPDERKKYLDGIGTDYKKYKEGTPERVFARYNNNQKFGKRKAASFQEYLDDFYIGTYANNRRGDAFHRKLVQDLKLLGPDWICEEEIAVTDPKTGKPVIRRLDAVNYKTKEFVEAKAGGAHDSRQNNSTRGLMQDPRFKDFRMRYAFGAYQLEDDTKRLMGQYRDEFGRDSRGRARLTTYKHVSTGMPDYTPGDYSKKNTTFTPPSSGTSSRGGATDNVNRSAPTPLDAKRQQERARALDPSGNRVRTPGGIDFTSLELRYVGKPVKGKGIDYAFSANKAPESNPGWGGKAKADMSSDAFFTWLALTPEKFWVNLNPDQPDTIMDDKFASTDAGRVLLEADLQLKHDFFKAMDPKTDVGKRAWDSLAKRNGWPCLHSGRNWIEPKPAQVREQDGGIYILDAPLKLLTAPMDINTPGPGDGESCELTKAEIEHNERVLKATVVPLVEKWINTAPEYADLRRVYTARVAAEWVRLQDAKAPTDYRKIINSNNVKPWPLRTPNQGWKKTDVFNKYVKIFKEGEFKYELTKGQEVWVITVGGVDFSKAPKRNITGTRFRTEHPNLPRTTQISVQAMTDDAENDNLLFLGGNTAGRAGDGKPDPAPTPTPTEPDPTPTEPGDDPSTPTPDPTQTGGNTKPPANKPDPDGDLADTGSDTPIGLIVSIAAALAAAGAALVWWMRRRKTAAE